MSDPVGQRLRTEPNGAYQLYDLVAAGAFGSVYFGRDLETNRAVAIKKLHPHWARDPRAVERFNQEAQAGRALKHPNVVQLLDQGTDADGIPFIVLQWVEGWTVAALFERHIKQLGAFPIDEAVEIAWQTLAGLEAARRLGLVHRDIKPLNLMVTPPPEQQVKVMDFGIAKDVLAAVTGDNTQVGTLAYMAPEQFTGAAVDARTDLYALGVTLYELLAGQKPFLGPTPAAYVHQHLYEAPRPLRELRPEIDAGLAMAVHRALARNPADRFQMPAEMQVALRPVNSPSLELSVPEPPEQAEPGQETQVMSLYAQGARARAQELALATEALGHIAQRRPDDQEVTPRLASADASSDRAEERPARRPAWGTNGRGTARDNYRFTDDDLLRFVVVAACALVVGAVLVGWLRWSALYQGTPAPTIMPTFARAVAATPAPSANLAASSVGKPTPAATVTTAVTKPTVPAPSADWQVVAVGLGQLNGIAVDDHGNIYVANSDNNRVQKLSAAGQPLFEWGSDWGPSPGQFEAPAAVAVDAQGLVYVADRDNNRLQKLSATGEPLAQWGKSGSGPGQFNGPMAVAVDARGNSYVADTGNDRIQKLSATGQPLAQWGSSGGQFSNPTGVALDGQGNVYVADSGNNRIQKLSATGQPLAQWGTSGTAPGQFSNPTGVAVDGQGNVYVTDRANARIQKLSAAGQPLAIWGTYGSGNGPGQFSNPFGVAVDAQGSVYVTDRDNNRIQKLSSAN